MRKIRDVLRLKFEEGLSLRQVAASVQMPFTTVGDYARRAERAGLSWPLPDDLDDDALEARLFVSAARPPDPRPLPDWQEVHTELRRPGVTLMLLWLEYKEAFPDGYAYSQFCRHYRLWQRHVDVVMRQEHKAGEKLFVDFAGQHIPIYDERTGELALEAELFVAVLGASSYLYAEAFPSQELGYWITGHVHAFEFNEGCTAIVVPDNLRSGVTRAHRYEPDVNATYQEMAAHYGIAVIPARSYKPRDKAKAEAGVLLAERWILARLRNRRFTSLAEANLAIRELVEVVNDRPFNRVSVALSSGSRSKRSGVSSSMRPSTSSASPKTTITWVEVSSTETRVWTHLRDTRSTMANTARLALAKCVTSQIQMWFGSHTSQSGHGARTAGERGAGSGSTSS